MNYFAVVFIHILIQAAAADDSKCIARHGKCQEDSNHCAGSYVSNMCSGHASRRCCLPRSNVDCPGGTRYSATGTGYYPSSSAIEGGFVDMRDQPLGTLQDYLAGRSSIVTVAMDNHAGIAYDTPVCIPEMNHRYGRFIDFRVRDTGSAFYHKGHSRIDICVRTESDSFDNTINGPLTLVFY
ncbi:uncharacterized protein LOC128556280 [Mercenaria mercenaria]|uniref:uncharacterized protein LOC128556280 n=2 Tax=Mercenaria mercenaria TaxID=6596 RepID=UPI00234EFDDC|nr:uncharacterized protein LOC128556280 [Mercenaria mercenaria]